MVFRFLLTFTVFSGFSICAGASDSWTLARNANFEVYSQSGGVAAQAGLAWLEQLRAFFLSRSGIDAEGRPPIRVIAFASRQQYEAYRLNPVADAFYVSTESRTYIVLPSLAPGQLRLAAHEFAHAVIDAAGYHLPRWLNDGFAEVMSTVSFSAGGTMIGADVPAHRHVLKTRTWLPLRELVSRTRTAPVTRSEAAMFYAEAWALTHMLLLAPEYAPRFPELTAALLAGNADETVLASVYGKSMEAITRDVRAWAEGASFTPVKLPPVAPSVPQAVTSEVAPLDSRMMLADLLAASGSLNRAADAYRELDREAPDSAAIAAARGALALRMNRKDQAMRYFQRAMELGIRDAAICYRFALLADAAGLSQDIVSGALARAIEVNPVVNIRFVRSN